MDEMDMKQSKEVLDIQLDDNEPIDIEWEPEERYQDFLKFYCSANELDDKKWTDIAKKLDTGSGTLQFWVQRISNNSESNTNNLCTQFAELLDPNGSGDIQSQSQIIFTRSNGSVDLFWSPSKKAVPSLQSLILINNQYIACVIKHLSTTHLRAFVIGKITGNVKGKLPECDDKKASKYILTKFPMIKWEPLSSNDMASKHDPYNLLNVQNITALGYRFKIPLIDDCIIKSSGHQIIECAKDDFDDCSVIDIINNQQLNKCKTIQTGSIKQSYYLNYKRKLLTSSQLEFGEDPDNIILHKVFPTGIKHIDLMNPLTKHGINIIIRPKKQEHKIDDESDSIFYKIGKHWINKDSNHVIYADIFRHNLDAVSLRNDLIGDLDENERGKLTIIAGDENESDWYKLQTVITAATIANNKNNNHKQESLLIIPNGNKYNLYLNNLQRNVCGGLSKLKFEDNDEIGHKPFDWIKRKKNRKKPEPTSEFYLNWGIEPTIDGATYIIGLKMDSSEIRDIRIRPSAYFPWADTVAVFDENDDLDIAHSSSKLLSEIEFSDLDQNKVKVMHGLRRLFSDYRLFKNIDHQHQSVILWNNMFNDSYNGYYYNPQEYDNILDIIYKQFQSNYDHDGNSLLDIKCLNTENIKDTSIYNQITQNNIENNPLMTMLENTKNDIDNDLLLQKLNVLYNIYNDNKTMGLTENKPEIRFKAKFDHGDFLRNTKVNLHIELFSDDSYKYGMNIGPHSMLFINGKPIKMPIIYGFEKQKSKQNEQQQIENEEEEEIYGEQEQEMLNIFEKSSKYDGLEEFGLNVLRYEKGKVGNRHDFFTISGQLTQDIYDICLFIFGYDGNVPFIAQKRCGPDALPQSPKKKKKKTKVIDAYLKEVNDATDNHQFQTDESMDNIVQTLKRKEFLLYSEQ